LDHGRPWTEPRRPFAATPSHRQAKVDYGARWTPICCGHQPVRSARLARFHYKRKVRLGLDRQRTRRAAGCVLVQGRLDGRVGNRLSANSFVFHRKGVGRPCRLLARKSNDAPKATGLWRIPRQSGILAALRLSTRLSRRQPWPKSMAQGHPSVLPRWDGCRTLATAIRDSPANTRCLFGPPYAALLSRFPSINVTCGLVHAR